MRQQSPPHNFSTQTQAHAATSRPRMAGRGLTNYSFPHTEGSHHHPNESHPLSQLVLPLHCTGIRTRTLSSWTTSARRRPRTTPLQMPWNSWPSRIPQRCYATPTHSPLQLLASPPRNPMKPQGPQALVSQTSRARDVGSKTLDPRP